MRTLSRRRLLWGGVLGAGLLAGCTTLPAPTRPAQSPSAAPASAPGARLPLIGYLTIGSAQNAGQQRLRAEFLLGLQEHGYAEGQNVRVEYRYADGRAEAVPRLAAALVALPADLILAADSSVVAPAREATSTVPIVMALFSDPVGAGLVASLARPGGNVTGLSNLNRPLAGKRLEVLQELLSSLTRVAVVWNPRNAGVQLQWAEAQQVAPGLGLELASHPVSDAADLAPAVDAAVAEGAGALLVLPDPLTLANGPRIVELAAAARLPALYGASDMVAAGGLISIAADRFAMMRRTGAYVEKILQGARPADLPIEQSTRFELAINLATARALGLAVPRDLLLDASEVVQ